MALSNEQLARDLASCAGKNIKRLGFFNISK